MTFSIKEKVCNFIDNKLAAQISFCAICASLFTYGFCYPIINEYAAGVFMTVLVIFECLRQRFVPLDLAFIFLLQGAIICAAIDFLTNLDYMYWMQWAWVLPMGYLLGKVIPGNDSSIEPIFPGKEWPAGRMRSSDKRITLAFISLTAGLFLQGLIDYIYGYIQRGEWFVLWNQFWGGESQVKNTYELKLLLVTCLLAAVFFIRRQLRSVFYAYLAAEALIIFLCFKTGGRINFLVLLLQIIFVALFNVIDSQDARKRQALKGLIAIILAGLALLIILSTLISFNIGGLGDLYYNSFWSRDGGVLHNVRLECIVEGVQKSFYYPLGGFTVDALGPYGGGSSHNMWLEYARQYGLVPLICFFTFSLITIFYGIQLLLKKTTRYSWLKRLLVPGLICLNMYHSMEPNAHANRNLWLFCLVISGMVARVAEPGQKQ